MNKHNKKMNKHNYHRLLMNKHTLLVYQKLKMNKFINYRREVVRQYK